MSRTHGGWVDEALKIVLAVSAGFLEWNLINKIIHPQINEEIIHSSNKAI